MLSETVTMRLRSAMVTKDLMPMAQIPAEIYNQNQLQSSLHHFFLADTWPTFIEC